MSIVPNALPVLAIHHRWKPTRTPVLASCMMLKNEHKRLPITLESVRGHVDCLIVYDTGSTDDTLNILRVFSETQNVPLFLKEGTFVDFSTSRNVLLDYADTVPADYLVLLDCNDELRGGQALREYLQSQTADRPSAWHIRQEWFYGASRTRYFNVRIVRTRCGWRYRGAVHEYMTNIHTDETIQIRIGHPDIVLYQDRTQDDDKTSHRFRRDYELLKSEYDQTPDPDPRTVFYLAQTCDCLRRFEEAYQYHKQRSDMGGFYEETFHSRLRIGALISEHIKLPSDGTQWWNGMTWEDAVGWYLRAYELIPRVEPLVAIGREYLQRKQFALAHMFFLHACQLNYPTRCCLFINSDMYEYTRYHCLGIAAYYVGEFEIGLRACEKAYEARHQAIDESNAAMYRPKVRELRQRKLPKKPLFGKDGE